MDAPIERPGVDQFIALCGARAWRERLAVLRARAADDTHTGRHALQLHCIELAIDRLRGFDGERRLSPAERRIVGYAADAVALHGQLGGSGRARLQERLADALRDPVCLVPLFHLLRTAALQRSRGFEVAFPGLAEGAPFDLLIQRGGVEAEIACDTVSADAGRYVHRGAWFRLVDRVAPGLRAWLRLHPGRYLLKLTFPAGLQDDLPRETGPLPALQDRILQMLAQGRRSDGDATAVLRLDPLTLAAARSDDVGLMPRLRQEFGPEAQIAVVTAGGGVFVLAARSGQQNEVAAAVRRRMASVVASRLTGGRPGILAMFVEGTDGLEWRLLRERLELEGEARQFLTSPDARGVVAVTCSSRLELFGLGPPDAAPDGELRFRNPAHPAAKRAELAPAVLSSI